MISNRQTNEFFNNEKQQSRLNNIKVVKNSNLIEDDKLICSWCELMGASGLETLKLLQQENIFNDFVGVDFDEKFIAEYKKQYPNFQWVAGNLFDVISQLKNVGVLNLDIYGNIGYDKDFNDLRYLLPLIKSGVDTFGEFILFYNKDLDGVRRHRENPGEILRYHTERICEVFDNYLPGRKFNANDILPGDVEKEINNNKTGIFGAYEIYKGKNKGHRLANLRLIFR